MAFFGGFLYRYAFASRRTERSFKKPRTNAPPARNTSPLLIGIQGGGQHPGSPSGGGGGGGKSCANTLSLKPKAIKRAKASAKNNL